MIHRDNRIYTEQTKGRESEVNEGSFHHYRNSGILSPHKERRNTGRSKHIDKMLRVNQCCVQMKVKAQKIKPPAVKKSSDMLPSLMQRLQNQFKKQEYDNI